VIPTTIASLINLIMQLAWTNPSHSRDGGRVFKQEQISHSSCAAMTEIRKHTLREKRTTDVHAKRKVGLVDE
jgi:hypothetical protein